MQFPIRTLDRSEFPPLLREIPDCPKHLFVRGTLPKEDSVLLCVVGSRAASPYAKRATSSLIAGLAGKPITIVSGLALGIDADAHKAALDAGLHTVAVLPSGLNDSVLYPRTNHALAQRIVESGGVLLSEYEPDFKPALYSFPGRNRIMAGMSHAALIVEASEKSGTLITARLALDYNRDVLAVPHEIGREGGAGTNRLIKEGAALVRDSTDILEILGFKVEEPGGLFEAPKDLSDIEARVYTALTEPMPRDTLLERAGLSAQEANIALSSLLIRGLIVERFGAIQRTY